MLFVIFSFKGDLTMQKKKILVTDDDDGVQDIFKLIFEKAGYEVEIYGEAISILENKYKSPDLFLLDRQLSGYDGLELCTFLKDQPATKNIPVIIVSATPGIGILANEAGADDFIEKPFDMKSLLEKVKKWI
jgi:DNA-binding response OmpR family regulator